MGINMKNVYEVRGEVTAIIIDSPKFGRLEALISTKNLEHVQKFPTKWNVMWSEDSKTYYVKASTNILNGKRTTVYLHRWVTSASNVMEVDHFNHNGLDNTDGNLRLATKSENRQNQNGARSTNKSGIRNVYWHKRTKKWIARIKMNGEHIHLGSFSDISEAEQVAIEARKKYMPYSHEAS